MVWRMEGGDEEAVSLLVPVLPFPQGGEGGLLYLGVDEQC